eukprot:TRINITY_DN4748_c0_g1_i1.p1 TRINITY_DN4748_c0_g1~~TRINITY_DN4748_c0_g1_i1.p1  ORF type:complete len:276 (-),score=62.38 TRINITY_DN4748_c0_g1_i1:128-955(-)
MKIVVGAATGNTGTAVVKYLSEHGHTVIAITRDPNGKSAKKLTQLKGVIAKTSEEAFNEPIDRAYLCMHNFRDQFVDETNFIINAKNAGVKYIVKLSTYDKWMTVYGSPYYARNHLAVEFFLENGDIPFTCLRANLFCNWLGFDIESVAKTGQFKSVLGSSDIAVIDPHDIGKAAATLLSLEDPSAHFGKKYMLTGPENVNDKVIAHILSNALKRDVHFIGTLTNDELLNVFRHGGYPEKDLQDMLQGPILFQRGENDLKHKQTPKEILELCPPK